MRTKTVSLPQANNVSLIGAAICHIASGFDPDQMAGIEDISARQGHYYFQAAETLGFAYSTPTGRFRGWWPLPKAHAFARANNERRAEMLEEAMMGNDLVDLASSSSEGPDLVATHLLNSGLSQATVARRTSTVGSWLEFIAAGLEDQAHAMR